MATIDSPIIRIGSLYFIPVDIPSHRIDLSDFSNEHSEKFGDAIIVDHSDQDPYRMIEDQQYVVVSIPFFRNGERLTLKEVAAGELRRTLVYLHDKRLRENDSLPDIKSRKDFSFDLQASGR